MSRKPRKRPVSFPLHNSVSKKASDATSAELDASIKWYETTIATLKSYPGRFVPSSFYHSKAALIAERASRVGKKKS